mgnify:CR=1 FL=1
MHGGNNRREERPQGSSGSRRTSSGSEITGEPLRPCSDQLRVIGRALALLCDAKRIDFSPSQLSTWATVLGCFPAELVAVAATKAALSCEPFPQLGDLVRQIQREANKQATVPTQAEPDRVSIGTVRAVMRAMRIEE